MKILTDHPACRHGYYPHDACVTCCLDMTLKAWKAHVTRPPYRERPLTGARARSKAREMGLARQRRK